MNGWLDYTHGDAPVTAARLDIARLISVAYMLTGSRPKAAYVHPDIFNQMVAALGVTPVEFYGVKITPNPAIPLWVISFSDLDRQVQLFDFRTGEPIKMEVP